MKIKMLTLLLLLSLQSSAINNDSIVIEQLKEQVSIIKNNGIEQAEEIKRLRNEVMVLNRKLKQQANTFQASIDSIKDDIESVSTVSKTDAENLGKEIKETQSQSNKDKQEITRSINNKSLAGVIALLIFVIAIITVYLLLKKRIASGFSTIDSIKNAQTEISNAQKQLQEDALKLDEKLVGLLDKQLNAKKQEAMTAREETDHSLAKKVADEIVRIELNLSRMDASVKGHKQLSKAVERIKNNFLAQGYEIVDMLGKPYHEGMRVVADFVMKEDLNLGEQIITGITKPQINYKGEMIQAAQITVSQNI